MSTEQVRHHGEGEHALDEAVIAALPAGMIISSIQQYGTSAWSTTASITGQNASGVTEKFFVKYATGAHGAIQLEGEYRSMQEIRSVKADFAPKPLGFGQLKFAPTSTYFFLCEFVKITTSLPNPRKLGIELADLHNRSQSPEGKFGFHQTTYDGRLPQKTDWDVSWSRFFGKLLLHVSQLDNEVNGQWQEITTAVSRTVEEVVPRLLGALEADGRKIKPCLIHGDLWEGNIGTHAETGDLFIFDAASYYAHNEMELGIWRCDHHGMDLKTYSDEYHRHLEPSEPKDEWDDRNRLYSVKTKLMYSAHVKGSHVRQTALHDLRYLIEKYGSEADS